ncbi:MAG: hypothetical protein NVS9B3_01490 [Gemmatimonadaceae bacterium]
MIEFAAPAAVRRTDSSWVRVALVLPLFAALAACSKDNGPLAPSTVATVEIGPPAAASMFLGQRVSLTATVADGRHNTLSDRRVTWQVSPAGVVKLEPSTNPYFVAAATALTAGTAQITATADGKTGVLTVVVRPPGPVAKIEAPAAASVAIGTTYQLTAVLRDADGLVLTDRAVTYASVDPAIATVSATGLVTAVAAGLTDVTITSETQTATTKVTVPLPPRAFLWSAAAGMTDLGLLPGFTASTATAINTTGMVAGFTWAAGSGPHAFRWTAAGGLVDLGVAAGGTGSAASAVNSSGVVVGQLSTATGSRHAALWSQNGAIQDLGTLAGDDESVATAIDDAGRVVGYSTIGGKSRAFIWTQVDGMKPIPGLGLGTSTANAMNKAGDVVGTSGSQPFVWSTTLVVSFLPLLPGDNIGYAVAINDSRDVLGISAYQKPACTDHCTGPTHVVLWPAAGSPIDLTATLGADGTAVSINASGQLAGSTQLGRAVAWLTVGRRTDLGALPGRTLGSSSAINDAGQVVGESH